MVEALRGRIPIAKNRAVFLEKVLALIREDKRSEAVKLLQENDISVPEFLHALTSYYSTKKKYHYRKKSAQSNLE